MKRRPGPNEKSSVAQGLLSSSMGLALISTPCSINNASRPGPTKEGSVVAKEITGFGPSRGDASFTAGGWPWGGVVV